MAGWWPTAARWWSSPDGGDPNTSVLDTLSIGPGGRVNLNNNDLIVKATAGTKNTVHADIQADIASAQNGQDENFITKWDGPGLTSATGPVVERGNGLRPGRTRCDSQFRLGYHHRFAGIVVHAALAAKR